MSAPLTEQCRSCGAPIVWLPTRTGKTMPVDMATVRPGDALFDHTRHVSHFATCPQADTWRHSER